MDCRNTSINSRRRAAFTLIEMMVAAAVALVATTALATMFYFSSRSFLVINNYAQMSMSSQLALDQISREIRQARRLTACSTNALTFLDANSNVLQYAYNPVARTVLRISGGLTNTYVTQCDNLQFWIYQHTPISNTFTCYAPAYVTNARVIQLTWTCSRPIRGTKATTESTEAAQIGLRNH